MLLTIDVGNTNTVLGVHEGRGLDGPLAATTRREQTADEYGILVRSLFSAAALDPSAIEGVALASVVPPLTSVLVEPRRATTSVTIPWWWSPASGPACPSSTSRRATWAPIAS